MIVLFCVVAKRPMWANTQGLRVFMFMADEKSFV
jgi:hypothetical protein